MVHDTRSARRAVAAGLAAALLITVPASGSTEHTAFVPLWIELDDSGPDAGSTTPGLLSVPPAWLPGDGAAIVIGEPQVPGGSRDGVVARLLGEGALVLELDVFTMRGFAADSAAAPPLPNEAALAGDLLAALEVLRREYDPGMVVAVGFGLGGDVALRAATARLPGGATGFIAGADLSPGAPRFARGMPPDAAEAWPLRLGSLCRALTDPAAPDPDTALRRCQAALTAEAAQAAWR